MNQPPRSRAGLVAEVRAHLIVEVVVPQVEDAGLDDIGHLLAAAAGVAVFPKSLNISACSRD